MAKVKLWAYWDHAPQYRNICVCEGKPKYNRETKFFYSIPHTLMQIESGLDKHLFSARVCPGLVPGEALEFEIEI